MPTGRPTSPALHAPEARVLLSGPPGSGKTTELCARYLGLVEAGDDPQRIAFFASTRRSARAVRATLLAGIGRSIADLPVFTIHGFCFGVMAQRFAELGYRESPEVLSASEQLGTVAELLAGENADRWPHFAALLRSRAFVRDVATFVLRAQDRLCDSTSLEHRAREAGLESYVELSAFFSRYLAALGDAERIDFSGLVQQIATLLGRSPEHLFTHVLIDDYQDATPAQEAVLASLARDASSVVAAADPSGSVFAFRGAGTEPLLRALESFGLLEHIELRTSHRAGGAAAAALDGAPAHGAPAVETRLYPHPGEEAEGIADELLRLRVEAGLAWGRSAVIVRRHGAFVQALRHALARHGVPHAVTGEARTLASEPAVRPVLDLFRYVIRDRERADRLEPLLVSPVAGLTPHEVRSLRREARLLGTTLLDLVENRDVADSRIRAFRALLRDVADAVAEQSPEDVFWDVWRRLPAFAALVAADERDGQARRALDALTAFWRILERFGKREPGAGTGVFLDMLDAADYGADPWYLPGDPGDDAVSILTAHQAHGTEFDTVIVANCLEGEFPTLSRPEPLVAIEALLSPATASDRRTARLGEERRTFRLAISRARTKVILSASAAGTARTPRTPSRYAGMLGVEWVPATGSAGATDLRSMESSLRRTISDRSQPRATRLAALAALRRADADPSAWWGRRDWTDPGVRLYEEGIRTSYSRLSPLDNCALQFLYQSKMGLDTRETHQMWLGTVVHQIIERVHTGSLPRDANALVEALDAAWKPEIFGTKAVEHRRYLDAKGMLERWLAQSQADPVAAEEAFEFELGGATLRGRIDAIFPMSNGHVRVVDYKTGRGRPSDKPEDDLQLAAYYLAMLRDEGLRRFGKPGALELHFIAQARVREGYSQVRFQPNTIPGYEDNAVERITSLIDRMREEDFTPSPDADCMWCSFKTLCPVWPEGGETIA